MAHYFTNEELVSEIRKLCVSVLGEDFTFFTDNGVFSKDRLDFGTRTFLENLPIDSMKNKKILDVGCGYGPIGIVLSRLVDCSVLMIDVNKRALHLADRNIQENHVSNVSTLESDVYTNVSEKFDFILTNPPIHAGKQKVYEIVMDARHHLNPNGSLWIVIRKDQGAKSMINDLKTYYNVNIVARNKGFFIISCNLA